MENYFKNRKEIEQFFGNQFFEFSFQSDGMVFYDTLAPITLGDEMFSFQLSFYLPTNKSNDFFRFSSFNCFLEKFQLASVVKISIADNSHEGLFEEQYKDV